MNIVAVISTLRPKENYLGETLTSLDQQGAARADMRFVEFDGPRWLTLPTGWQSFDTTKKRGSRLTYWQIFRRAAAAGAKRLLIFEDDVKASKNAVAWALSATLPQELAFIAMLDVKEWRPWWLKLAIHKVRTIGTCYNVFSGAQALVFPEHIIRAMAQISESEVASFDPHNKNLHDTMLSVVLWYTGHKFYGTTNPSIFAHIGTQSMVAPGTRVKASNYGGDDFDAMTIGLEPKISK